MKIDGYTKAMLTGGDQVIAFERNFVVAGDRYDLTIAQVAAWLDRKEAER